MLKIDAKAFKFWLWALHVCIKQISNYLQKTHHTRNKNDDKYITCDIFILVLFF